MKRLMALLLALVFTLTLTGCANTQVPETVGSLGNVEIPGSLYRLVQYNNYSGAASLTPYDQSQLVQVLKATVTDPVSGEEVPVLQYIEDHSLEQLYYYAGVLSWFDELGLSLDQETLDTINTNVDQIWNYNGSHYEKNGIDRDTLALYMEQGYKAQALLEGVYGPEGITPVTQEEYLDYMENQCYAGEVLYLPISSMDGSITADQETMEEIAQWAETAAGAINGPEAFTVDQAALEYIPVVMELLGQELPSQEDILSGYTGQGLFLPEDLAYYEEEDGTNPVLDVIKDLEVGQAGVIFTGSGYQVFLRQDPVESCPLEQWQDRLLEGMKVTAIQDQFVERGKSLENHLDQEALDQISPGTIQF